MEGEEGGALRTPASKEHVSGTEKAIKAEEMNDSEERFARSRKTLALKRHKTLWK